MRGKSARDHGFLLAYIINLILNSEWAVIALLCYGFHKHLDLPAFFWQLSIAILFIWPLIITFFLTSLIRASDDKPPKTENKNPYSASTEKYINNIKK